jgi:hypothetical protein
MNGGAYQRKATCGLAGMLTAADRGPRSPHAQAAGASLGNEGESLVGLRAVAAGTVRKARTGQCELAGGACPG